MHTGKQKQMNVSYQASLVNRHIRRFTGNARVRIVADSFIHYSRAVTFGGVFFTAEICPVIGALRGGSSTGPRENSMKMSGHAYKYMTRVTFPPIYVNPNTRYEAAPCDFLGVSGLHGLKWCDTDPQAGARRVHQGSRELFAPLFIFSLPPVWSGSESRRHFLPYQEC